MTPLILLRLAVRGLLVHKLRSALSVLGIVFGVGAVTAISSVAAGAQKEALAQVGALGIDTITLRARPPRDGTATGALRVQDADAVLAVVPRVVAVAPLRESSLAAEAGSRHTDAIVLGTTPAYAVAGRLRVARGRFLAALDVRDRKRVAVLGASVSNALFPLGDAIGQRLRLGDDVYDVVGVLEGRATVKGRVGPIRSRDVNRAVLVPLPTLDRGDDPRPDGVDEIVLRVEDAEEVAAAAEVARAVVLRTSASEAFDVVVPREILRQRERTQRIFNVVTGAVAAISLLVGGIGIMNIMLASVAERTREVGVRRAVGASRRDVAAQFLVEASLLTGAGGVLGAGLGIVASVLIQVLAGWPTAISLWMLLAALVTAVLVGVGFGSYPAWQAAQLQPMEALRQ